MFHYIRIVFLKAGRVIIKTGGHYHSRGISGVIRYYTAIFLYIIAPVYSRFGRIKYECPCCGWKGAHFLPYIDKGYVTFQAECPGCHSHPRHRGHILFYRRFFQEMKGRLLYVAPEFNLRFFLDRQDLEVKTSEYAKEIPADYHYDLMQVECPDRTWDCIICHHVIEHVPDDGKAMRELLRILKPGGSMIMSVPIARNLERTLEYGKPNPHETDHYYRYGRDFADRLPPELLVTAHDFRRLFSEKEFQRYHLKDDYIFLCRKPPEDSR